MQSQFDSTLHPQSQIANSTLKNPKETEKNKQ